MRPISSILRQQQVKAKKTSNAGIALEILENRELPSVNSLAPLPPPWVKTFHGDFNGDGRQDVAGFDSSGQWWVSLSTGNSFTARTPWAQWSIPSSWNDLFIADVNGDGRDDIVGFGFTGAWFVGLSNGSDSFATGSSWAQWSSPSSWSQLLVGDFNGDRRTDIFGLGFNGALFVGLSNGTDAFATGSAWAQWSLGSSWHQLLSGDFNGDGKSDIAGFGNNGAWFVGVSNGADAFVTGAAWAQWSPAIAWNQVFVGDFDGDLKTDIAGFGNNGAWFVGLSNGSNQFTTGAAWQNWMTADNWSQIFVADVNGDGKSDAVGFAYSPPTAFSSPNGAWYVGLSNGANTFVTDGVPWALVSTPNNWSQWFVADFTGDGTGDIAGFTPISFVGMSFTNNPSWVVGQSSKVNHFFAGAGQWVIW